MGTAHWHTAVRHIPPSGYVPARGYRPILCSHTPVSRIPESCSRSSLRNGISTVRSDCDGSFPHAAPFLPPIHNICDRNAPPPGFLHSTSGPSLFHTEIHPFLFSSFWNFIFFDLLKKGGYSSKYPPFLFDSFSYFTAPVIPSVKLFWKQKKMIAVGIVQMNTPSISTP